jgi:hypothetical protein
MAHYAGWDALVEAAWRKDADRVRAIAVDMAPGPEGDAPAGADGLATTSGALGFVGFAASGEELAGGIAVAARGCGECHAAVGAVAPPRPAWTHETAAAWAVDAAVWTREGSPSGDVPIEVASAWSEPVALDSPQTRVERVLTACGSCH